MRLNVYSVPHEKTSPMFAKAFAQGCGGIVKTRYESGPWSGFGSPETLPDLQRSINEGHDWFYGDHGYFGRGLYYRITKNDYFHRGEGRSNRKRLARFYSGAKSWAKGSRIILCPQSDSFFRRNGTTQESWIKSVTEELKLFTDRKIIVHAKWDRKPLKSFFIDAHCIVSHSSNSAVEALMNGVPAINLADSSSTGMTRNSLSDVENLLYPPNRLEWAGVLADNQWTLAEIAQGMAWRTLNAKV